MIIDFKKLEETSTPAFKGGLGAFDCAAFIDDTHRIMRGHLAPGSSIGFHSHDETSEILFIHKGEGHVIEDGETKAIKEGMCNFCPKGKSHSLINDGISDMIFFAVVAKE